MTTHPSGRPATYVGRVRRLVASCPKRERLFFAGSVNRTAGAAIAVLVEANRVTPNLLSVVGLAVHAVAASILVLSSAPIFGSAWMAVLVLWQLAFSLDGADGQLARLRGGGSAFGAWLDTSADVVAHVMVYGALAVHVVGAVGLGGPTSAVFTGAVLSSCSRACCISPQP
ncbi:MAG: CDP-alcohol phosphatidyltransferase family protein [Chloroflexi bacterium]|nr:CDP-alcohol phosphatidyltransferase family protein [Chloroflexota bacterium]